MLFRAALVSVFLGSALVLAGCAAPTTSSTEAGSVGLAGAGGASARAATILLRPEWPRAAWAAVPVATVWNDRKFVRSVDAEAVAASPRPARWLAGLTYLQLLDLDNRVATQALLDDPLLVLGETGGWAHVLVRDQTGSVYRTGIAGWMPVNQLTLTRPQSTAVTATVSVPLARTRPLTLSYGTRLPVLRRTAASIVVGTPGGALSMAATDLRLRSLPANGAAVLAEAERFLGLPYMWAGTSAFGFDCSGLSYMVYRQFGVRLPRDAADQARLGVPVGRSDLRPGDLIFFASGGNIHHVAFYAGGGYMLDAPQTGGRVELVPLWTSPIAAQYAGARRYLP
jgi:cell wall-associated NlpC family hydrolase